MIFRLSALEGFQSTAQHYTGYNQTASMIVPTFGRLTYSCLTSIRVQATLDYASLPGAARLLLSFQIFQTWLLVAKLGWLLLQLDAGLYPH